MANNEVLLDIRNLTVHFFCPGRVIRAVRNVNLAVKNDEFLGIAGESGCGKTVTALSIMGLIRPPGKILNGEILYKGMDLAKFSEKQLRMHRGEKIAMIFQNPVLSLNPMFTVSRQLIETLKAHESISKTEAWQRSIRQLKAVGFRNPQQLMQCYPHELSGGMCQRVMITMGLICHPNLLIADEPVTALDITIKIQVLELLKSLHEKLGISVILITHDLTLISEYCDRIAIMYAGKIVEVGETKKILFNPLHPYTRGLLNCTPDIESDNQQLQALEGRPPEVTSESRGCDFYPRCPMRKDACEVTLTKITGEIYDHAVRCLLIS